MARGSRGRSLRLSPFPRARRLGLAAALVALLAALAGRVVHAQPARPVDVVRVVTLRAVAEEKYRAQLGWEAELRRTVKTVSDIYERTFQIRFQILDVVPWTVGPAVPLDTMKRRLRQEVPIGAADVLVGFAAERCEGLYYGVAQLFGRVAMVQTACLDTAVLSHTSADVVLSHELAHLFGAFHPGPAGAGTVMRYGPADRFDGQNLRVIRLTRTRDFTTGVQGVDAAARQAWSAIYAEGHASDEPNPLAGAVANAGMTLAAQGKESDGEAMLREAAAIDPRAARVRTMLGLLLSGQGRLPEAAKELEAARSLSFRETEARTELGFVLLKLGREEEALTELRDVLRVDRRASRPYVGVGMILARRRRMAEAITAFRGALSADPGYGPAHLELAGALDAVGQPAEAWPAAARAHDLGEDVPADLWQRLAEKVPSVPPLPAPCAGATGSAIDLDRPPPDVREYVTRIRDRIRSHRAYPRLALDRRQGGELQIELQVARNGRLECAALRRSSGSEILDRYMMTAVRLAQPLPPMPPQLPQPSLILSGTYGFRVVSEPQSLPRTPAR